MLVNLYKSILASLGVFADEDGFLTLQLDGEDSDEPGLPMMVDGRRLALPTPELLRRGKNPEVIPFHPVSESYSRGESKVFQHLKKLTVIRVQQVLVTLLGQLTHISVDRDRHNSLSPTAHKVLDALPEADQRTLDDMTSILERLKRDAPPLFSLYVKRGGELHGRTMHRVAVSSWPIMELFDTDDGKILGVKVRKKDQRGYLQLLRYILPHIEEKEGYNAGSMSNVCPYLDCLVQAFVRIARDFNAITSVHRQQLGQAYELTTIDLSWEDSARDWSVYREEIPPLEDSVGGTLPANGQAAAAPQPASTAPAPARVEAQAKPARTVEDILNATQRPPVYQPQPVYQQPVYQQPTVTPTGDYPGYYRGVPIRPQPSPYGGYYQQQPVMSPQQIEAMNAANAYGPPQGAPMMPPMNVGYPGYPGYGGGRAV